MADSVTSSIKEQLHELQDEPFVFLCKQPDTYVINKAILYVRCDAGVVFFWLSIPDIRAISFCEVVEDSSTKAM